VDAGIGLIKYGAPSLVEMGLGAPAPKNKYHTFLVLRPTNLQGNHPVVPYIPSAQNSVCGRFHSSILSLSPKFTTNYSTGFLMMCNNTISDTTPKFNPSRKTHDPAHRTSQLQLKTDPDHMRPRHVKESRKCRCQSTRLRIGVSERYNQISLSR
jgi:hypothetical protein